MDNRQQYTENEIEMILENQFFKHVEVPKFQFPEPIMVKSSYTWYKSYIKIAAPLIMLPAFIFVFTFLFNNKNVSNNLNSQNLSMLEESNARLLAEIDSLNDE